MDHMSRCWKSSGHPGAVGSRETAPYVQMLNIKCDDIDWVPETSAIYIFEPFPAADWLRWKSAAGSGKYACVHVRVLATCSTSCTETLLKRV